MRKTLGQSSAAGTPAKFKNHHSTGAAVLQSRKLSQLLVKDLALVCANSMHCRKLLHQLPQLRPFLCAQVRPLILRIRIGHPDSRIPRRINILCRGTWDSSEHS